MLFKSPDEIPPSLWPWKNFEPDEPNLACPCCGEMWLDVGAMNLLQAVRDLVGKPMRVNSGHRCPLHNARVGGAPLSQHKRIAFDINLHGHDRMELMRLAGWSALPYLDFIKPFYTLIQGRRGTGSAGEQWNYGNRRDCNGAGERP